MKDKVFISMFVVFVLLIYTVNGEDKDLFVKDFGTKKPDNPKLEGEGYSHSGFPKTHG